MDFSQLKANVQDAMGRTDVPDYVYTLTTAGINRDCRFLDMQTSTTIDTSSNPADLPSDFQSVISAYIQASGENYLLSSMTDQTARLEADSRIPRFYAIQDGKMLFAPEPDGTYTVSLQYIANLADLVDDTDTNDVMSRYPDLYLYQALTHASIWAKDRESEQSYGNAYAAAMRLAKRDDISRRMSQGITTRSRRW